MADPDPGGTRNAPTDLSTYFAAERTLLAWIRTGLAMMGFGFVVARFGLFLREMAAAHTPDVPPRHSLSLAVGTSLVLLGVVVNVLSGIQYARFLRQFGSDQPYRPVGVPLGILISLLLAVLGASLAIYLLVVR